jgi:hypothetical protein
MDEPAEDILRFIAEQIDTVPQIEALLLLWQRAPAAFTAERLASWIFVEEAAAAQVLRDLQQRKFVTNGANASEYVYDSGWDPDGEFVARVGAAYRQHLVRIATLIHSKASPAVREFARAFESKKKP